MKGIRAVRIWRLGNGPAIQELTVVPPVWLAMISISEGPSRSGQAQGLAARCGSAGGNGATSCRDTTDVHE